MYYYTRTKKEQCFMSYRPDDNGFNNNSKSGMDELDLSKAREKKVDNSKTLRNGRYDGLRSFDELPPLKIDMMKEEKRRDVSSEPIKTEKSYSKYKHSVYKTEEEKKRKKYAGLTPVQFEKQGGEK